MWWVGKFSPGPWACHWNATITALRQHAMQEIADVGDFRLADRMRHRVLMPFDRVPKAAEGLPRLHSHRERQHRLLHSVSLEDRHAVVRRRAIGRQAFR